MPDLKTVIQNLMHSNLSITDRIYGVLLESDVRGQIGALGKKLAPEVTQGTKELILLIEKFLDQLRNSSANHG